MDELLTGQRRCHTILSAVLESKDEDCSMMLKMTLFMHCLD